MTRAQYRLNLQLEAREQKRKKKDKRCYWQGRSYLQQYEESLR